METMEEIKILTPKNIKDFLDKEIGIDNKNEFIIKAIIEKLNREKLKNSYKQAYNEIKEENKFFEGTILDGLS